MGRSNSTANLMSHVEASRVSSAADYNSLRMFTVLVHFCVVFEPLYACLRLKWAVCAFCSFVC